MSFTVCPFSITSYDLLRSIGSSFRLKFPLSMQVRTLRIWIEIDQPAERIDTRGGGFRIDNSAHLIVDGGDLVFPYVQVTVMLHSARNHS